MYRGYIKNINSLNGNAISNSNLRIREMKIKCDLLTKVSSTFSLIDTPTFASEGDVFGVYDDYGNTIYEGVITSINDVEVQTIQLIGLFNDKWVWNNPNLPTIEETIKQIIINDFVNNDDTKIANTFSQFTIETTSETELSMGSKDGNSVVNFMSFLFDIYKDYQIMLDIKVGFSGQPTITIGQQDYDVIRLTNNTNNIRNLNVVTETAETNKLIVYNKDGDILRGTYYATTSGITTESTALNRLAKINTDIVFSDDEITDIVYEHLSEEMFNHKITLDLVMENKLYKWELFHLGQFVDIFYLDKVYNSVLTGYQLSITTDGKLYMANLTFGKVRQTIESKLYQEFTKIVEKQQTPKLPTNMFEKKEVSFSTLRVSANSGGTFSTSVLPDKDYTIIGFAEIETNSSAIIPYKWTYADGVVSLMVRNVASNAVSATAIVRLLEVKI